MTANQDTEHLRLLSIFHYVHAAIVAFYSLFAMIYVVMGVLFLAMPFVFDDVPKSAQQPTRSALPPRQTTDDQPSKDRTPSDEPKKVKELSRAEAAEVDSTRHHRSRADEPSLTIVGIMFVCFGVAGLLIGLTYASVQILVARFIKRRKHRVFCMIVSGLNCMNVPIGLILGVFTLIVLARPSVRPLFENQATLDAKSAN
jgi:hypothetical protein